MQGYDEDVQHGRRMDMSAFGATGETLVLNANHPLVKYVLDNKEGENTAKICEQLYDLANPGTWPAVTGAYDRVL